jgi:hypothetical protein
MSVIESAKPPPGAALNSVELVVVIADAFEASNTSEAGT